MRNFRPVIALLLLCALVAPVMAQRPTPTPQQQQDARGQEDRVRVTTNLVQLDVIVTDKDGRQVTDLKPDEFEISEDGKRPTITNFSYVSTGGSSTSLQPSSTTTAANTATDKTSAPAPAAPIKPELVRRTMALVVDDLGVSFESMGFVRKTLKKFVDEQMQPGDLVAVLRTSGGTSALQQFTTDKRVLHLAIDNMRWVGRGRGGITPYDVSNSTGNQTTDILTREAMEDMENYRGQALTVGTIGALNMILRGLESMPGRKSVILLSENAKIFDSTGSANEVMKGAMKQLAEYSNRASAIVYTIDTSGLQTLDSSASSGNQTGRIIPELGAGGAPGPPPVGSRSAARSAGSPANSGAEQGLRALDTLVTASRATYFESQAVLRHLAESTGGIAIRNTNDLSGGLQRVLEDQGGYYLIGYRPDESTIDPKTGRRRAHDIKVKVRRPGLKARTRDGYFGLTDEEARATVRTRDQQLQAALSSPFAGDVRVRLTPLFGEDQGSGSFVRAMVYVDARDLKFTEEADGNHKATLDLVAITFDGKGTILDQVNRTETMTAKGETYQRMLQSGVRYDLNVPVKQAGAYQLRIAVRDATSERTGTASQFISIPDLTRGSLTLSSLVISGINAAALDKPEAAQATADPQAGPAVRRLRQGMVLEYGYVIYNAQLEKATGKPNVTTQVRLFRDGQPFFSGRVNPYDTTQQKDMKRLLAGGRLMVGKEMTPGDYVVQVIVTDLTIKEKEKDKRRTATQWIDFEVVK
jgi:VWFA-related protein